MAVVKRIQGWKRLFIDQIRAGRTMQEAASRQNLTMARIHQEFEHDSEFRREYDDLQAARTEVTGAEFVRTALKW